jgi:hypothetical protein
MNLFEGLKSDWIYINGFRRIIGAVGKFDPDAEYTLADAIEAASPGQKWISDQRRWPSATSNS